MATCGLGDLAESLSMLLVEVQFSSLPVESGLNPVPLLDALPVVPEEFLAVENGRFQSYGRK